MTFPLQSVLSASISNFYFSTWHVFSEAHCVLEQHLNKRDRPFFLFVSDRQVQVAAVAMECLPSKRGHSADADRLDEPQRRREQHVSDLRRWHPDAQSDVSQTKRFSTCQPSTLSRSHPLTHGSTVSNACLFFFFFFFPLSSEPTLSIKRFD